MPNNRIPQLLGRGLILLSVLLTILTLNQSYATVFAQSTENDLIEQKVRWWAESPFSAGPHRQSQPDNDAPVQPAMQDLPPWTGMAVQVWIENNWEIYLYGVTSPRLTNNPAADTLPRLNIGGTELAFVSDRDGNDEIYRMNVGGSAQTRLTFDAAIDTMPYWSPDSHDLVFVSDRTGNAEIFRMEADGQDAYPLTNSPEPDVQPAWSPNGLWIAWVRRSGLDGVLWVMNADGSQPHPITVPIRFAAHPVWSPDSSRIAFDADFDQDGFSQLAVINADGSGLQLVQIDGAGPLTDYWMGSWNLEGYALFFSRLYWLVEEDHLVLSGASIGRACAPPVQHCTFWSAPTGFLLHPDMQSLDILAPQSSVHPLPVYSRQSGFFVHLSARDRGPSGLQRWNLQYRDAGDPNWNDSRIWVLPFDAPDRSYVEASEYVTGAPLGRCYFRSSAIDYANNREPWPSSDEGHASTLVYNWFLSGRLTDARGIPRQLVPVTIEPSPYEEEVKTDYDGAFTVHLRSATEHLLQGSIHLPQRGDQVRADYQLPHDNLLQDGDFEAVGGPAHWQLNGSAIITQNTTLAHSGASVAVLGQLCAHACFQPLPEGHIADIRQADFFSDPHGNLHIIGSRNTSLFHQMYSQSMGWQPYTVLSNQIDDHTADLGFGADGALHLVWAAQDFSNPYGYLYYTRRSPSGEWTTPVLIGRGGQPRLAVDGAGRVHLLSFCPHFSGCQERSELYYWLFTPGQGWSPKQIVVETDSIYTYQIVAHGNQVDVVWSGSAPEAGFQMVAHLNRNAQGKWSMFTVVDSGGTGADGGSYRYGTLALRSDSRGHLHLAWQTPYSSEVMYTTRAPGGPWSAPQVFGLLGDSNPYNLAGLFIDQRDQLHLLGYSVYLQQLYRQTKGQDRNWSTILTEPYDFSAERPITSLHMANNDVEYATSFDYSRSQLQLLHRSSVTEATVSRLQQVVTIPPDLHRPTLAFMHEIVGSSSADRNFAVTISDSLTTTAVYSSATDTAWRLGWADLTPWLGETITVTFGFTQPAGVPYVQARVDQVSIGSWRTPVVESVTPARVPAGVSATLIITGDNFIETPAIRLGDTLLTDVRWIDDRRIEAVAPATLDAGVYNLWVTNPDGSSTAEIGAVRVGEQAYLPMLSGAR